MSESGDILNLQGVIKKLCNHQLRNPMTYEQTLLWIKQFEDGSEKKLALLILRFLIYRSSDQLKSSLKLALKFTTVHFIPDECVKEETDWRNVLIGEVGGLTFKCGPIKSDKPGKSGEVISNLLKKCNLLTRYQHAYADKITELADKDRFLLVDDGTYTGSQIKEYIQNNAKFMIGSNKAAIVVGFAHEEALKNLAPLFEGLPKVPIFYGEKITQKECFEALSKNWVEDGLWENNDITPIEQYYKIIKEKAKFKKCLPLGYGGLGCMVAYGHGIPNSSLQLLWGESSTWKPLIQR